MRTLYRMAGSLVLVALLSACGESPQTTSQAAAQSAQARKSQIAALEARVDRVKDSNDIKRLQPRPNADVNQYWMCDEGRLNTQYVGSERRLTKTTGAPGSSLPGPRRAWSSASTKRRRSRSRK